MSRTWMAPARAVIDDLPPTLPGLVSALRTADEACSLLARSTDARTLTTGPGAAVLMCALARACLEPDDLTDPDERDNLMAPAEPDDLTDPAGRVVTHAPVTASLTGPADPDDPSNPREVDGVLRACIDLAIAVLDNDQIDLDLAQVSDIGSAVALLDRARAHVLGLQP